MEYIEPKLIEMVMAISLGAASFYRIVEMVLEKSRNKKRAFKLYHQVNTDIVFACIAWSQKLEMHLEDMKLVHRQQLDKIRELEKVISELEKRTKI